MYGDPPVVDIHTRLRQWFCWHKPKMWGPHDYYCPKCDFYSDDPLTGIKLRHLWWLVTGRMPKKEKK